MIVYIFKGYLVQLMYPFFNCIQHHLRCALDLLHCVKTRKEEEEEVTGSPIQQVGVVGNDNHVAHCDDEAPKCATVHGQFS